MTLKLNRLLKTIETYVQTKFYLANSSG